MNDPAPTDLHALLDHPEQVAQVPAEQVPPLLATIASEQARLAALQGALAARLAVPSAPANGHAEPDVLLDDVREVARIVRHSVSWVRRNGRRLPGFRQPGGKGCKVSWSRRALEAWVTSPTP